MGKIIAISNQKGGVGKTTTCVNLGSSVALLGKKTLIIDFDPQSNATGGFGINKNDNEDNIYSALIGEKTVKEIVKETMVPNLYLATSSVDLSGAEVELSNHPDRAKKLKALLESIKDEYNYIFIDCPPSMGILTLNALVATDSVLIPLQCEYYALEGISQLLLSTNLIRQKYNPSLSIEGIVFTMYDGRNNISKQVIDEVRQHLSEHIFDAIIPRNVRLSEAPSFGKPIFFYDRSSKGSISYFQLAKELLYRNGEL